MNLPEPESTPFSESLDIVAGLQEEVYARVMGIRTGTANTEDIVDYYHYLYAMLEKQQILLTRVQLMKDPSHKGILTGIELVADAFQRNAGETLQEWHTNMKTETLQALEKATGEVIDPSKIELDIWWDE